jgi:hypothetical protein
MTSTKGFNEALPVPKKGYQNNIEIISKKTDDNHNVTVDMINSLDKKIDNVEVLLRQLMESINKNNGDALNSISKIFNTPVKDVIGDATADNYYTSEFTDESEFTDNTNATDDSNFINNTYVTNDTDSEANNNVDATTNNTDATTNNADATTNNTDSTTNNTNANNNTSVTNNVDTTNNTDTTNIDANNKVDVTKKTNKLVKNKMTKSKTIKGKTNKTNSGDDFGILSLSDDSVETKPKLTRKSKK